MNLTLQLAIALFIFNHMCHRGITDMKSGFNAVFAAITVFISGVSIVALIIQIGVIILK